MSAPIRKFAIITDSASEATVKKMADYFKSINAGWSRYFVGGWLVSSHDTKVTANMLVEKFMEFQPGVDCIAFEMRSVPDWSFMMHDAENTKNLKSWLESQWS